MAGKDSPQSVIDSYRKRQHMMPFVIWGLVVLLLVVGIIILAVWFLGPGKGSGFTLFASRTPTPTATFTPTPVTPTNTPTVTPTITETPTITPTFTPSAPFEYTVEEGDSCWTIAEEFEVTAMFDVLMALNNFSGDCPINPGDVILIPIPGQELPTETPLPTDIARGTKIEYTIKLGETLAEIASKFNSTVESIMAENGITDENTLQAGQKITVSVNLVTPTPTLRPTNTITPGGPTLTPSRTATLGS